MLNYLSLQDKKIRAFVVLASAVKPIAAYKILVSFKKKVSIFYGTGLKTNFERMPIPHDKGKKLV